MSEERRQNRLAGETSPYLLQHADNPVDWYPWGDEAIERARRENIPVLLSVGYSACHWCHVMAHESFEDPAVAEVMNRLFVNVKVDREERPDLDRIYQIAHQLLNRRPGGWPLTLFLDPRDLAPFLAGTYFPKQAMQGMPGFPDLCQRVAAAWEEQRDAIREQGDRLRDVIQDVEKPAEGEARPDTDTLLGQAFTQLRDSFDERFGGFGSAPKFPHPTHLALADWLADAPHNADIDRAHAGRMRDQSLVRMAESGLFDQVGGGWYRYSVDPYWMIPHFEKMLYDNGPLLGQTAMRQGIHASLERAVPLSVDWLAREMAAPEGGFYATLDADSEGEEGRFYLWDRDELRERLDEDVFEAFARRYGLDRDPNFEGRSHLHAFASVEAVAEALDRDEATVRDQIEAARRVLFELRESRVRPGRDEKILTAWNGLMITGLATAATRDRHQTRAGELAAEAADFLLDTVQRDDGRVWAVHKDGRNRFPGYLDDHVFLAEGLLTLLQWDWREHWLTGAQRLVDAVLEHFRAEDGGFYFTADDHDRVLTRPRPLMDESTPAGNGVAARALLRLGWLLAEPRYLEAAEACLASAAGSIARMPEGHATLLIALAEQAEPPPLVVVRDDADGRARWRERLQPLLPPGGMLFTLAEDDTGLPAALAGKKGQGAWLCTGTHCETVTGPQSLEERLTDWV